MRPKFVPRPPRDYRSKLPYEYQSNHHVEAGRTALGRMVAFLWARM